MLRDERMAALAGRTVASQMSDSFEHYAKKLIAMQKGQSKWSDGDNKLLNRSKDGLICYFGKHDVTKITTGMVRDYLTHLDGNRKRPLAHSTKSKHVIIIRKVLTIGAAHKVGLF
ncbi:phage integrase SAM-like domain-containing protein [Pseudophaeobacter flagellatus]|uniref:phage integrase SAM-like domain-containing protein n=1 Tax=Pseudophaeobacter flagellatus TaxID=2899119 RepID=UPI001E44ECCE|nr:phage integrase SAM-like domain-containing protein [Pseudophaeobacter flagellatus]MCD9147940.1 phage integrase SAM-like domain-containing protein [Pseudophaeobacter flagellatus]